MKVPQISAEPDIIIHPTGTFEAKFIDFGEIKFGQQSSCIYTTAKYQTEHGFVFVTFMGSLDTINLLRSMPHELAKRSFHVRVDHRYYEGKLYPRCVVKIQEL